MLSSENNIKFCGEINMWRTVRLLVDAQISMVDVGIKNATEEF